MGTQHEKQSMATVMTKTATNPDKTLEVKEVQKELQDLQEALAQLVDALIAEGKPGPKEIKKLQGFKKRALSFKSAILSDNPKPMNDRNKQRK